MSTSPKDLEQRAERAVRRGELLVALELFEAVLAQKPDDERVRQRMESVRALLQPSELVHRRRAEPEVAAPKANEPISDAEQGELHAAGGRFDEALQSYRRAVAQSPANELFRERLDELLKLAPPGSRALEDGLASAPRLEGGGRGAAGPDEGHHRSAHAAELVFNPDDTAPIIARARRSSMPPPRREEPQAHHPDAPLPEDPVEMLRVLLGRIRGGRRRKPAGA
jgi:tetratricopeptide (TPR) repeat protein